MNSINHILYSNILLVLITGIALFSLVLSLKQSKNISQINSKLGYTSNDLAFVSIAPQQLDVRYNNVTPIITETSFNNLKVSTLTAFSFMFGTTAGFYAVTYMVGFISYIVNKF